MRYLALLLLLVVLSACSTPFNPPSDIATDAPLANTSEPVSEGAVTISFAAWDAERSVYEALARKFMANNPGIKVVIVSLEDFTNIQQKGQQDSPLSMLRRVVSGADTAPALFTLSKAYGTNLLLNLQPLMEADSSFKRDDFYPGTLEKYQTGGGIWVMPRYFYVQLLSYNKDLFKQANLPMPKPGWSWNDLLGNAEQLAVKRGNLVDTYGFLDPSGGFGTAIALLQSQNIDLTAIPPSELQLDRPEIVAVIERMRSLTKSGALFQPQPGADPPENPQQLVRDGRVGIWSADTLPTVNDGRATGALTYHFSVGKVPYPVTQGILDRGSSDGYIISGGTTHPNESWKWIEFLSRQQTDQGPSGPPQVIGPGRVPARASLADQIGFWKGMDEETAAAYRWVLANQAKPSARNPDFTAFGFLAETISSLLADPKADIKKALIDAQKRLDEQVARTQLTPTPAPDTSPILVASPEPQVAPEGTTTITFGVPGYTLGDMRRLARLFRQQQTDIFVQIKSTDPTTQPLDVQTIAQANDCFAWWGQLQNDKDFNALLDLQPLIDADATFPKDDYPPGLLTLYQHNGALVGLPYTYNARVFSFNRTTFDASGIQPPRAQWSTADFLAAAQALTQGEGDQKQYGYVSLGGSISDLFFFSSQFGAQLITGSGIDARPNFTDPKVIDAIKWYLDLANVQKVMPPIKLVYDRDNAKGDDTSYQLVQEGRAGMWFDWGVGAVGAQRSRPGGTSNGPKFEVGFAPLPVGDKGMRASDISVRGFHISSRTRHPQACWNWIKFISGDVSNIQNEIPARISIAQSKEFANQVSPQVLELSKVYQEVLKKPSQPAEDAGGFGRIDTYWFMKAIDETIQKKANLAQGLAEAQKTTLAYLDCLKQLKEYKPATCANQVDPTYKGFNTQDPGQSEPAVSVRRDT